MDTYLRISTPILLCILIVLGLIHGFTWFTAGVSIICGIALIVAELRRRN